MEDNFKTLDHDQLLAYLSTMVKDHKTSEIDILLCLREVMSRRLELKAGFCNIAEYCQEVLGLSADVAWKKVRAARIIGPYPKLLEMLGAGKTHVSHIAMIANKITQANEDKIYEFLPGASKRDLQFFLERLRPDGKFIADEPMIEITIRVKRSTLDKLDHAGKVLAKSCPGAAGRAQVLEAAIELFLEKKDPVRKAQRSLKTAPLTTCPGASEPIHGPLATGPGTSARRPAIPARLRHEVVRRDNGQCTYIAASGKRCSETVLLHIDHIKPWSHGGLHTIENLRLLCAMHNNLEAERVLGKEFMQKQTS